MSTTTERLLPRIQEWYPHEDERTMRIEPRAWEEEPSNPLLSQQGMGAWRVRLAPPRVRRMTKWGKSAARIGDAETNSRSRDQGPADVIADLLVLCTQPVGDDDVPPDPATLRHAAEWITRLWEQTVKLNAPWLRPHVVASPHGEVVFEWWHNEKSLTVFVYRDRAEYVLSWGADIHEEMSDGAADSKEDRRRLWLSLTGR